MHAVFDPQRNAIVLVPGFLGFGCFGAGTAQPICYFRPVRVLLEKQLGLKPGAGRIVAHEPPCPTGALSRRVVDLAHAVERAAAGGRCVHLVGHSTGGLDARLLVNAAYRALPELFTPEEQALLERAAARVVSITAISPPT